MVDLSRQSIEKYQEVSAKLTAPLLLSELRSLFERRYSILQLLMWIHEHLKFDKGNIDRHSDPLEILDYGRGRCGEFSILFTCLCLVHGFRARLVLDMSDHVWVEVWNPKRRRWIHIDPSEKKVNDPFMYERDWKKNLKEVYAFENGRLTNVTKRYKLQRTRNA